MDTQKRWKICSRRKKVRSLWFTRLRYQLKHSSTKLICSFIYQDTDRDFLYYLTDTCLQEQKQTCWLETTLLLLIFKLSVVLQYVVRKMGIWCPWIVPPKLFSGTQILCWAAQAGKNRWNTYQMRGYSNSLILLPSPFCLLFPLPLPGQGRICLDNTVIAKGFIFLQGIWKVISVLAFPLICPVSWLVSFVNRWVKYLFCKYNTSFLPHYCLLW